jgi:metallo-beta-lactamase class B
MQLSHPRRIRKAASLLTVLAGAASLAAAPPPSAAFDVGPAAYDQHIARALEGVPKPMQASIVKLCNDPEPFGLNRVAEAPPTDVPETRVTPMRVFDQLYFVGDKDVSVWVLKTTDGLILFDSGFNTLVQSRLIAGLVALGLRPEDVKYVVVTHAHADHYGGAKYLQDTYHAHVLMGAADWKAHFDPRAKGYDAPMPHPDIVVSGERSLTLGRTTVRLIPTPGHTPGTLSALIPVTDHGEPHVVALWGGGFPNEGGIPAMKQYAISAGNFRAMAAAANADVAISNHPKNDDSLFKMKQLAVRSPGSPNIFVGGVPAVSQRLRVAEECSRAYIAAHPQ